MENDILFRPGRSGDAVAIASLWKGNSVIRSYEEEIKNSVKAYPSIVAYSADSLHQLVGFAYSAELAPEVLELKNIMVAREYRQRRIGSAMLRGFEEIAVDNFYRTITAFNSDFYETREQPKLPATTFYLNAGYNLVDDTGNTRTFIKSIG